MAASNAMRSEGQMDVDQLNHGFHCPTVDHLCWRWSKKAQINFWPQIYMFFFFKGGLQNLWPCICSLHGLSRHPGPAANPVGKFPAVSAMWETQLRWTTGIWLSYLPLLHDFLGWFGFTLVYHRSGNGRMYMILVRLSSVSETSKGSGSTCFRSQQAAETLFFGSFVVVQPILGWTKRSKGLIPSPFYQIYPK